MGYRAPVDATESTRTGVDRTFAHPRKAWAYRSDQLASTHPIVADIGRPGRGRNTTSTASPTPKAPSVLRAARGLGRCTTPSSRGCLRVLPASRVRQRRACATSWRCLEAASGRDLRRWSRVVAGDRRDEHPAARRSTSRRPGRDHHLGSRSLQTAADPVTGEPVDRPHRVVVGLYDEVNSWRVRSIATDVAWPGRHPQARRRPGRRWCWSTTTT